MARKYDELDEMLVPQDHSTEIEDEVKAPKSKKVKKGDENKTPRQLEKEAAKKKETMKTIAIVVVCFVLLLGALIGVGLVMSERAGVGSGNNGTVKVEKADPAPGRTYFKSNIEPELSAEGVKGRLKEAYYTVDGGLAVTLRLSNGMSTEQELVKLGIRIFNGDDETVAQQTIDKFKPACKIRAGGYSDYYFEIDKSYVSLSEDSLKELGTTLEIGSKSTSGNNKNESVVGDGPKDIANGRTYYENTGNIPELSADGVKASVIRARYTNDGSLSVTLSLSNGTDVKQQVSMVDLLIENGEGATIADYTFDSFATPCTVESQSYTEYEVIVDAAYVPTQDDPLSTLACTVSVSAAGIE